MSIEAFYCKARLCSQRSTPPVHQFLVYPERCVWQKKRFRRDVSLNRYTMAGKKQTSSIQPHWVQDSRLKIIGFILFWNLQSRTWARRFKAAITNRKQKIIWRKMFGFGLKQGFFGLPWVFYFVLASKATKRLGIFVFQVKVLQQKWENPKSQGCFWFLALETKTKENRIKLSLDQTLSSKFWSFVFFWCCDFFCGS